MIIILGPSFPWKGGVAHHTNSLANALIESGVKLKLYTFSKQYPHFLYPGKEQQEPHKTTNPLKVEAFQVLNPLNPFSWFLTAYKIIKDKPTYCLIQYWHPFFSPCFTVISWLLKLKDIKVICIVQTLIPHDRHYADTWLMRLFFYQIYGAILDQSMHKQFKIFFPYLPFKLIQLPVFDQFGEPVDATVARKYLKLPQDKKILLFFGFIRKYKGLDILLEALPIVIKKQPDVHLVIAGECFGSYDDYQKIIQKNRLTLNITSNIGYIPNEDVRYWFGGCDLLVMPYRHIINSGVENIGKIYAKKSLLTLASTPHELAQKILLTLNGTKSHKKNIFGWQEYSLQVREFLNI